MFFAFRLRVASSARHRSLPRRLLLSLDDIQNALHGVSIMSVPVSCPCSIQLKAWQTQECDLPVRPSSCAGRLYGDTEGASRRRNVPFVHWLYPTSTGQGQSCCCLGRKHTALPTYRCTFRMPAYVSHGFPCRVPLCCASGPS